MQSIAQSLKEKNRLVGRINKLQDQIRQHNKYDKSKVPDFNSRDLLVQLQEEWARLIDLKTRIAVANVGIADKLVALAEAKGELVFWQSFAAHYAGQAEEKTQTGVYDLEGKQVWKEIVTVSTITSKEVTENESAAQRRIENLQDTIDAYNSTTVV